MHRASVFGVHLSRFTTLTRSYNKLKLVNRPAIRLLTNAKQTPEEIEQDLTENMEYETIPSAAKWLTIAGVIPFAAGTVAVIFPTVPTYFAAKFLFYQLLYSNSILSFMGATHWGLAMAKYTADGQPPTNRQQLLRYSLSVVPPLVSWVSLGLPPSTAMMVNLFAFAGVFVGDALAVRSGLAPYWWIKLRAPVTFAVILCLGISWVAMNEERF